MTAPGGPAPGVELELIYEDERLVAVDKPSGLIVHRGWARDDIVVVELVRDLVGHRVWPLHRLDRGTSGVLHPPLQVENLHGKKIHLRLT